MRKTFCTLVMILVFTPVFATTNPMFDDGDENSMMLYIGQSTGNHNLVKLIWPFAWDIYPQTLIMASYAQPTEFFRLPARMNISFVQNIAYESSHGLTFVGVGLSWDVALFEWRGFYFGVGLGPYYRDNQDRWVSSRFMFGEKVFLGKNFYNHWRGEIFTQHFSNGDITDINTGFNFAGIGINYSF